MVDKLNIKTVNELHDQIIEHFPAVYRDRVRKDPIYEQMTYEMARMQYMLQYIVYEDISGLKNSLKNLREELADGHYNRKADRGNKDSSEITVT